MYHHHRLGADRRGFTLIELMVTMAIIATLIAVSAAGLSFAYDQTKRDKTRSLVDRLHALVMQKYESYRYRRLPIQMPSPAQLAKAGRPDVALAAAEIRCDALRLLMRMEMPERWTDITDGPPTNSTSIQIPVRGSSLTVPMAVPSVWFSYYNFYFNASNTSGSNVSPTAATFNAPTAANPNIINGNQYQSAKCLYLLVTMGLEESDVLENFSPSDIGDPTGSGCNCFLDAWGNPIEFLRWAPGFVANTLSQGSVSVGVNADAPVGFQSDLQTAMDPDWTDPLGVRGNPPSAWNPLVPGYNANNAVKGLPPTFALYPLIYSAGSDGYYDIVFDGANAAFHYSNLSKAQFYNDPFATVEDPTVAGKTPSGAEAGAFGTPALLDDSGGNLLGWSDNIHNHTIGAK